jgi:hypothetical protein
VLTVEEKTEKPDNESIQEDQMAKKTAEEIVTPSDPVVSEQVTSAGVDAVSEATDLRRRLDALTADVGDLEDEVASVRAQLSTPAPKVEGHSAQVDSVSLAQEVKVLRAAVRMLAASKSPTELENFFISFPTLRD